MKIRTLGDIIMVRAEPREKPSNSILWIPAQCQIPDEKRRYELARQGRVLVTGPGKRSKKTGLRMPVRVKPGDRILFEDWMGAPLPGQNQKERVEYGDVLFMHEDEVLATIVGQEIQPLPVAA